MWMVFALLVTSLSVFAQAAQFTMRVNKDTVLMGNVIKVTYTVEQVAVKKFETPDFPHFKLVSGPNTSMSMSIVNGETKQKSSYSFYLEPDSPGTWTIPSVTVETSSGPLTVPAHDIVVLPNPEGIKEPFPEDEPDHDFFRPFRDEFPQWPVPQDEPSKPAKPKKKRRIYSL